MSLLIINHWQK